jgi:CDGSH-type Zn-finger protein
LKGELGRGMDKNNNNSEFKKNQVKLLVERDGPYIVSGNLPLSKEIIITDRNGDPVEWHKDKPFPNRKSYALCRCGQSKNKPYCDGFHREIGFDGTETASEKEYESLAERFPGPGVDLTDVKELCASARFCHRAGGTWKLVEESDDSKSKEIAIQESGNCPSGRLVVWDKKTGKPIEPEFQPSISLVEDPQKRVSGPIWLKGGVLIESSRGGKYEIRNRVTLCRCGSSENKPFCDGRHIDIEFDDGHFRGE